MPHITYRASSFGPHWGSALSGTHNLNVTWQELVWGAITVGKPGVAYLLAHGWHSVSDNIVRSHTVYANLQQVAGRIEKSSLYGALDPTEKGATSYFMGMMAAKILSSRLLSTPWLLHVSMFPKLGGTLSLHSNSTPDLIGRTNSGDWVVLEAKGRTHGLSKLAMTTAKTQTRQLRRINGQFPTLRAAVQAFFQPDLRFAIEDPDDYAEDAEDLTFEPRQAFEKYYSGYLRRDARVLDSVELDGQRYITQNHEEIGVTLGIDKRVVDRLSSTQDSVLFTPLDQKEVGIKSSSDFTVFPDGVAVALDSRWSEARMQRAPAARRDG
ncbi:MAG: hypothetical protein DDT39_01664 [Firmicutes bacterium]|nr:hypothetical protein [candidate division NPL-UPA2 bacterium]